MLTRSDILSEAIHKCLVEMYKWAQPAIDLDKLIADGYKDSKEDPLYRNGDFAFEEYFCCGYYLQCHCLDVSVGRCT